MNNRAKTVLSLSLSLPIIAVIRGILCPIKCRRLDENLTHSVKYETEKLFLLWNVEIIICSQKQRNMMREAHSDESIALFTRRGKISLH